MKETIKVAPKQGYVFNEMSGKLESFEFIRCVFALNEDIPMTTYCKLGGVDAELQGDFAVYDGENSFKINSRIEWSDANFWKLDQLLPNHRRNKGKCWTFINGRADYVDVINELIEYADSKFSLVSGRTYYTRESEVYKFNDIIVKNADGSERIVESIATKMKFTPSQMSAIYDLRKAIEKVKGLGIRLGYDVESGIMDAYNSAIGDVISDYDEQDEYIDCHNVCEMITDGIMYICGEELVQIKLNESLK